MTIRPIQASDLPGVLRLTRSVPEAPWWSEAHIRQLLGQDEAGPLLRRAWVAERLENPEQVAGFIVLHALRLPPETIPQQFECEIESIVVDLALRRQGMGRRLLATATAWCREREATILRLEVRSRNLAAIALYQQAGFITAGHRVGYYQSPPDDAVLMELRLASG